MPQRHLQRIQVVIKHEHIKIVHLELSTNISYSVYHLCIFVYILCVVFWYLS